MAELANLIKKYESKMNSTMRLSCTAISVMIITRTPEDTGSARASWNPNIGPPITRNVEIRGNNPDQHRGRIAEVTNRIVAGQQYSLANGQDYIRALEYGHSEQARGGMVRRSVAQWQSIVAMTARQVR